ncbi:MAG: TetR/AcrR family transcriptional regulator [Pseudoclavibacter sp.]
MRGQARERAILAAAYELLGEDGYDALTIDAVAAQAHASKATIYSHWPDKAALVTAALEARSRHQPDASLDSGDLREDLRELIRLFVYLAEKESLRAFVSVILASTREPALLSGLNDVALVRRKQDCHTLMEQAASRGEPTMSGDLLFELLLGKILTRYLLERSPLTEEAQIDFIDEVLLPLMRNDEKTGA